MKNRAVIISVIFLVAWVAGCAQFGTKSPEQLSKEYTAQAQEYEKKGDLVEALKQYKLVLTVDPENKLAIEKSTALESQLNELAEKHYKIGLKYYRQGQYPPARKEFLTALRYNPDHVEAKEKLTAARKEIEHVTRYISHTLQADETIATLAERYYGDYRKFHLIAEYNELEDATKVKVGQVIKVPVIEGTPIIADPAKIQSDSGEPSEALPGQIITVKRYIIHTVKPEETLSKLAKTYYGDLSKFDVIAKFNSIEDGSSLKVGQELKIPEVEGLPFLAEGETVEKKTAAVPKPTVVRKKVPPKEQVVEDQSVNYRELGIELYKNKEYADAITEFNKVLNLNPADKVAINYMALAYFEKGRQSFDKKDYPQATDEFETSLKYNKDCADCRKYITTIQKESIANLRQDAIALYNQKKYPAAIVKFEALARKNPNDSQVNDYLAKSHFEQGLIFFGKEEYLAARDEFKSSLQYDKNCAQCQKNIEKCETTYKQVHYDKGLAYFGDQKLAEAIQEWESVSKLDPNYKDVNKNLTKAKTLLERLESIKRSKTEENKK
ncbi:MAG: tetratricopeptide repeat protein [Desulfobacterales bacterium]|jgi:tetratricopeptide (TPR) repeat protein